MELTRLSTSTLLFLRQHSPQKVHLSSLRNQQSQFNYRSQSRRSQWPILEVIRTVTWLTLF